MESDKETLELGEFIRLSGFKEIDRNSMVIVKKIVGNFLRDIMQKKENVNSLEVNLKAVHKTEDKPKKFELHLNLDVNGKIYNTEIIDSNVFVGLSDALKKLDEQIA